MLFKGTPTRPPGAIDTLIEGFGGNSNAFTSYDFTHYDVLVPAAHVRAAMELLADIAVNASFVPAELEAEKKVVFEEMNILQDDPDKFLTRRLSETAYVGHPYGRSILGTRELVRDLTRDAAERVLQEALRGRQNMVLVVVGPVPVAQVRSLATDVFGRLAGPAAPPRPPRRSRRSPAAVATTSRGQSRRPGSGWRGRRRPPAWRPRRSPPWTC